ncbi:hypothetical protein ACP4OV_026912 [Aristida adscensionis]
MDMAASRTTSTCFLEQEQGTHAFDVLGYSLHRGMGVGKGIASGVFSVGGFDWAILFYPDGRTDSSRDYVSVHLELCSKGATACASCDLRLVDRATGLPASVVAMPPRDFCHGGASRIAPTEGDFKRRSELEASPYLRGDRLTIECVVTVLREPRVSAERPCPRIEAPPSDLAAHLGKLLEAEKGADVTLTVAGETFAAHKIVLAMRSPVFKAELYGPMSETAAQPQTPAVVAVSDMQPVVFKALLHFIYTDALPAMGDLEGNDLSEMIRHLLVAADRYAMDRLKLICQSILCEGLDVQDVATTLALADQHHCSMLKDACVEFISSAAMDDIVSTQGFLDLKKNCPAVLVDAFVKVSNIRKM